MIKFLSSKVATPTNTAIIGITGYKGKTITSHIISDVLSQNGYRVAYLTSSGFYNNGELDSKITSDSINKKDFQKIFKQINEINPDFLILELPIKNISQKILKSIEFDSGIITNINEKKDSTKQYNEYFEFINMIKDQGLLVVDSEDTEFTKWIEENGDELDNNIFCYWVNSNNLLEKSFKKEGIEFKYYDEVNVNSSFYGKFSFENIYIALRVCSRYLPVEKIKESLSKVKPLKGKLDKYSSQPFSIYIDEAVTKKQIESSLSHISAIKGPTQKLISVVGLPDTKKNESYDIGNIIAKYSDILILAPSDSNLTQTYDINSLIHNGAESFRGRLVERIYSTEELNLLDKGKLMHKIYNTMQSGDVPVISFDAHDHTGRLDALKLAVLLADNDDIVYISGKGANESIIFDEVEYEWSDYEALRIAIEELA